ncbi:MAG: enoyl-CoA hydratase-related protein [Dehalococcoidales bacterium]
MAYKNLLLAKEDGIGIVTINRPKQLNTLNAEVFGELYELFGEIENDSEIRVVILTGAGDRAFAAGVDILEMRDKDSLSIKEFIIIARRSGDRIYNLNKPVIAAINGFAFGGGNELALACDLRIASENARFGQQEINLGLIPGGGAIPRLTQLVGLARAKEIVYTGDVIDAETALRIGLVNKVVPPEKLMEEARALAGKLLGKSSLILSYAKKAFNTGLDMSLADAMDLDESYFADCFATEDQKEGMAAFIEKRKPEFKDR